MKQCSHSSHQVVFYHPRPPSPQPPRRRSITLSPTPLFCCVSAAQYLVWIFMPTHFDGSPSFSLILMVDSERVCFIFIIHLRYSFESSHFVHSLNWKWNCFQCFLLFFFCIIYDWETTQCFLYNVCIYVCDTRWSPYINKPAELHEPVPLIQQRRYSTLTALCHALYLHLQRRWQ